jgi:hypothetical protein
MLNVITILIGLGLASVTVWVVLAFRKRDLRFHATVSRQWLMHHQGDDRP